MNKIFLLFRKLVLNIFARHVSRVSARGSESLDRTHFSKLNGRWIIKIDICRKSRIQGRKTKCMTLVVDHMATRHLKTILSQIRFSAKIRVLLYALYT